MINNDPLTQFMDNISDNNSSVRSSVKQHNTLHSYSVSFNQGELGNRIVLMLQNYHDKTQT